MKTGILIHGLHLETENWEEIMFGKPPFLPGRVVHGISLALSLPNVKTIMFGSGLEHKSAVTKNRFILESHYIFDYLYDNYLNPPYKFKYFQFQSLSVPISHIKHKIREISQCDTTSYNTQSEIIDAFNIFKSQGIERMVLVSCPTHLPRCLRNACDIGVHREMELLVSPSSICFAGAIPADVKIDEPPHRPDDSRITKNFPPTP